MAAKPTPATAVFALASCCASCAACASHLAASPQRNGSPAAQPFLANARYCMVELLAWPAQPASVVSAMMAAITLPLLMSVSNATEAGVQPQIPDHCGGFQTGVGMGPPSRIGLLRPRGLLTTTAARLSSPFAPSLARHSASQPLCHRTGRRLSRPAHPISCASPCSAGRPCDVRFLPCEAASSVRSIDLRKLERAMAPAVVPEGVPVWELSVWRSIIATCYSTEATPIPRSAAIASRVWLPWRERSRG
jgi:hypothetical protein